MDIDKDQNQDESNMFIERELEEDSNENGRDQDLNEMEYYCDEPSELINVKYIEDYSRQNFFLDMESNINNNEPNINYNNKINNNINNNNDYFLQNYNNIYDNSNFFSNNIINQGNDQNKIKIFNIAKYPRYREYIKLNNFEMKKFLVNGNFRNNGKEGRKFSKNQNIDWDNIEVPKEKHFHFDRKKHRIVFQRKHLKVIYSVIGLSPPIDFLKCFNMIKEQIGDKTLQNFGKGKSFHIIRENGQEKIVTLKDKKIQLKKYKLMNKKENSNNKNEENEYSINN